MSSDKSLEDPSLSFAPSGQTELFLGTELPEIDSDRIASLLDESANETAKGGSITKIDRWFEKGLKCPWGFKLDKKGLAKLGGEDGTKAILISGPIVVLANTADTEGSSAGIVIEFQTMRDQFKTMAVQRKSLHEDPKNLAQDLASQNFFIMPGKEKDLLTFLAQARPTTELIAATKTGWAVPKDGKLVFVLPEKATDPDYVFQPERFAPTTESVRKSGTLDEWIEKVFTLEALPLVNVLLSLSAPLLNFTTMATCGINWWSESSCGKTTLVQIAASVWGSGADPGSPKASPFINRWNTTRNALEVLASTHNDLPMIMDETGSGEDKGFDRLIYDVSGGQGKSALDAGRNLKARRSWQTLIISTGEKSGREIIENGDKKKTAKGGTQIRLLDYYLASSPFRDRQQVDQIKINCAKYYGTLGPAFIDAIIANYNAADFQTLVSELFEVALSRIVGQLNIKGKALTALQERSLKLFVLAEIAGNLLIQFGLVPKLTLAHIQTVIDQIVSNLVPSLDTLSDGDRAIKAIADYLLRFKDTKIQSIKGGAFADDPQKTFQEVVGYFHVSHGVYCFKDTVLEEIAGTNLQTIKKALKAVDLLAKNQDGKDTYRISIGGEKIKTYGIKKSILADADERS